MLDIIKQQATLTNPYTTIKQKLISTFGKTKYQMCDELLDMTVLGSGRPSLLMSNMLALLPEDDQPGTLFLVLFLHRLPEWMRRQLKVGRYQTPDELWEAPTYINSTITHPSSKPLLILSWSAPWLLHQLSQL